MFWFNKLQSGAISSIMTSPFNDYLFDDCNIPELLVATEASKVFAVTKNPLSNHAPFIKIDAEGLDDEEKAKIPPLDDISRSGNPDVSLYFEGVNGTIYGMESIPGASRFALASDAGTLQIWDIVNKTILLSRSFTQMVASEPKKNSHGKPRDVHHVPKKTPINSIAFSKSGKTVAVGFSTGRVRFLETATLKDLPCSTSDGDGIEASKSAILKIAFSPEGDFCATADQDYVITLFRKETVKVKHPPSADSKKSISVNGDSQLDNNEHSKIKARIEWVFVGRRKTHFKEIIGTFDQ